MRKCDKIVCADVLVPKNEIKIFLGDYNGFQRYDFYKYGFAKNIERKMRGAFWTPEEISLVTDRLKFRDLPEFVQTILTKNLLFQTLMDSGQNRGLDQVLADIATSPEWEAVFKTQGYFELIHSLSYSHIVREVFSDRATELFDGIADDQEIIHRIDKEIETYTLVDHLDDIDDEIEKKKLLLELFVRIYALEGLKFYVSFLVTYTINNSYQNAIQGITRIIKLINFDEDMHVTVFAGLLGILLKNPDEGFSELMKSDWYTNMVHDIFTSVVEDEIVWGEYLLSFGNVPTLTTSVIEQFVKYYADNRLARIKMDPIYNAQTFDVVDWFEHYKNPNLDNVAQQESEAIAYNIGTLQNDLEEEQLTFDWNNNNEKGNT